MYSYPDTKVARINLKPLLKQAMGRVDSQKTIRALEKQVAKSLKTKITQSTLSSRAKVALKKGFEIKTGKNSVTVVAKHPGFRPLLEGQRSRQMTWLVKSPTPIPIITDQGDLIFRNATPRSMENGSWYHPGRKPSRVLEKARVEAREAIREKVRKQIVQTMTRAK